MTHAEDSPEIPVEHPAHQADPNRWRILALLGSIQFMLLLDATVVSVALPPIQRDLGFTQEALSWVLNAYVLASGGFLLLGGRLADVFGRRRIFLVGLAFFGGGSLFCALAWHPSVLVGARFIQGLGEAFAAPAALGIIAVIFTDPFERIRALSIWGGIAGAGGAAGSVVGGVITSFASWHWLFLVNIPITIAAFIGVFKLLHHISGNRDQTIDVWGAITATAAVGLIVIGTLQAVHEDLTSPGVALPFTLGIVFAVAFIVVEQHVKDPLIPPNFFNERVRLASNILAALGAATFASYPFTMTLYAQEVLGYTPLDVGLMMLPLIVALALGLLVGTKLLAVRTFREVAAVTGIAAALGLLLTSFISVDSTYLTGILPGMILFGFAIGLAMPMLSNGSLFATTNLNSSLASAVQTTAQQAGSALGLALLAATATATTSRLLDGGMATEVAQTGGYAVALRIGAAIAFTSLIVAMTVLPNVRASDDEATSGIERDLPHNGR